MSQNRLISFVKTPVFFAKEYLHRRPASGYQYDFAEPARKAEAASHTETMKRDGFVLLPGHFKGELLAKLQQAFEKVVAGKPDKGNPDSLLSTDFLDADPIFMEAALDNLLLEIVAGYYQKPFSIGRSSAMRLLPSDPVRGGSFQWHHDARGRQVHLMLLLTDMPKDGQKMTYLKGSHETYYDHYRGLAEGSRFEKDVASQPELQGKIVDVSGPAGTVALFDANGLHSGNRNRTATRDTLTFCYVTYRHFKKIICRKVDVTKLPQKKQEVLKFNPYLELKD